MTDDYERATELNASAREAFTALPTGADPAGTAMAAISMATVHALLAIADAIRQLAPQPVGACAETHTEQQPMLSDDTVVFTFVQPCVLDHGHTGAHRDKNGRTW